VVAKKRTAPPALGLLGRYDLSYRMQMEHAGKVTHYVLTARLDVAKNTADEDVRTALLSDVSSAFAGENPGTDMPADSTQSYRSPFRMRLLPSGEISEVGFGSDTPQSARAVLQQIATLSQLAQGETLGDADWTAVETDPNARYEVRYHRRGMFEYQKTWTAKHGVAGEQAIFTSDGTAKLTTGALAIEGVDATLTQSFALAASRQLKTIIKVSVVRNAGEAAQDLVAAADDAQEQRGGYKPLDKSAMPTPTQEQKDIERVGGRSFARIVSDIERADAGGSWQLRKSFGFDLASLIRMNPGAVQDTVAQLKDAKTEPVRRTLVESLANAGTPQAQAGLIQVMDDEALPREVRAGAVKVSAFIGEPSPELLAKLDTDSRSENLTVRTAATIALASALSNNKDAGGKDAEAKIDQFLERGMTVLAENGVLKPEFDKGDQRNGAKRSALPVRDPSKPFARRDVVTWVQAIAATYEPKALPMLADALVFKGDRAIRAQAALGLGAMPAQDAAPLLGERILNDKSHIVRHHALSAITNLGPEHTFAIAKDALFMDSEPMVRAEAAFAIGHWANQKPEMRNVLDEAFKKEHSRVVQETILSMTNPGRGYKQGIKKVAVGRSL
jgi:HEAT repeat protein